MANIASLVSQKGWAVSARARSCVLDLMDKEKPSERRVAVASYCSQPLPVCSKIHPTLTVSCRGDSNLFVVPTSERYHEVVGMGEYR